MEGEAKTMASSKSIQARNQKRERNGQFANEGKTRIPHASDATATWLHQHAQQITENTRIVNRIVNRIGYNGHDSTGETWLTPDPNGGTMFVTRRGDTICSLTDIRLDNMPAGIPVTADWPAPDGTHTKHTFTDTGRTWQDTQTGKRYASLTDTECNTNTMTITHQEKNTQ